MNSTSTNKSVYRVPPSLYWAQYWNSCLIGTLATFQLILTLVILAMEIGNALVDLYKANIYSGFWSFPFTIAASITTYACVCAKKTQTKAIIALIFQIIAILVLFAVISFVIAFIVSDFTMCFGFQCNQTSTTFVPLSNTGYFTFSSTTSSILKRVFVICELVCAVIFIINSITYIILFIKCLKKLPRIHPLVQPAPRTTINHRLTSSVTQSSRPLSVSHTSYNQSTGTQQTLTTPLSGKIYYNAEKVCPNCKHVSPYIPGEDIVECPECHYKSKLVEHAQQS